MATYSSILAWKIPWKEEPGELQFMGSERVGHNWATEPCSPPRLTVPKKEKWGFSGGAVVKNPSSNAGDKSWIPDWGTKIPHILGK